MGFFSVKKLQKNMTPKDHLPDSVFHAYSEYMLDNVPALNLVKLFKKKTVDWLKMGLCIKASPAQPKYFSPTNQVCFPRF